MTKLDLFPGGIRDPIGLSGGLPPPNSIAEGGLDLPLILPQDNILFLVSFIRPQMPGEMGPFLDIPTSFLLDFFALESIPCVFLHPVLSSILGVEGFLCLGFSSILFSILLHFLFGTAAM